MVDDREIIYLALRNQVTLYIDALEDTENPLKEEERELAEYILFRTHTLEKQYEEDILKNTPDNTISRPKWQP